MHYTYQTDQHQAWDPTGTQSALDRGGSIPFWWQDWHGGDYEPTPISPLLLMCLVRINAHHESALDCKRVWSMYGYEPPNGNLLEHPHMEAAIGDYWVFGNAYFQRITGLNNRLLSLRHIPARAVRVAQTEPRSYVLLAKEGKIRPFKKDEVVHIKNYTPESELYGMPHTIGAIRSILLNDDATVFRRRYYKNGAHMGGILAITDGSLTSDAFTELKEELKAGKGAGNFHNTILEVASSSQNKSKVEFLSVGDLLKDDFEKCKNISRGDILAAHRIPPRILGVTLKGQGAGSAGDLDKEAAFFHTSVIASVQQAFTQTLNPILPEGSTLAFKPNFSFLPHPKR